MDDRRISASDASAPARGPLSIRALMIALVLAVLLPAAAVLVWFLNIQLDQARAAANAKVRLLVDNTVAALQSTLNDQQSVMGRLVERPQVRALDADNFDAGVAEYIRVLPEFSTLTVRDRDARPIFTSRPIPNGQNQVSASAWFQEGLASGQFRVSDAFKGPLTGRWLTVLTHPVRNQRGEVAGLMSLAQDLLALNQRILGSVPSSAVVTVTDRTGHIVLRSLDPELWLGKPTPPKVMQDTRGQLEAYLSAKGPDGVTRLYAFVTMASTGWRVVAGVPEDEAFSEHRNMLRRSLVIGAGLMLLALLAAWQVARGIVGPIAALSRAATRVADGDGSARAPVVGPAEIRSVARYFNRMVDAHAESEEALRHSENSLAITLQSIGDAVIATDLAGRVTRMNPTAERLTGWPAAEARGRPLAEVFRIIHRETREPATDPVQRVLSSGAVVALANHTALLSRDGAEYQIADSAAPIRDQAGHTVGMVLVFSDISERYRAEQAARAHADVLRLRDRALAEISQGVLMTDTQARITYVNPGFERLTGYAETEVLGRTAGFLQGAATSQATVAEITDALRAGTGFHGEALYYRKDGSTLWMALDISPLRDEQGVLTGFVAAQRDISERKQAEAAHSKLEAQLRESQKMESIGTLAGGIAHDFNNILGAILGNLALAREDVGPGHAALRSLEQIERSGRRARALVQQILAFSRRQMQVLVVQPLQPILQETLALLRSGLPAMVELDARLVETPLYVNADATQMQQVLMNLGTNAWHALSGSTGRIEIGLDERLLDAAAGEALGGLPAGRYAHLWVSDTGVGMDEPTRARIFEPFFTTKAVGDGTGLGLSVVHGIVKAHRGSISVSSAVGKGSTIDLYFPACDPPIAVLAAPAAAEAELALGHGEQVLYVDDDEVVGLVVERLLQRAGWRARSVANAGEALAALAASPFDLVVTDFNMPGSSGLDLAAELARRYPLLPVVIISGYVSNELVRGAEQVGVRHLLQKQDLFEALAPLVLRLLSEPRAGSQA
ncbi:MAG: PAS domain S-box protein [Burkholderiaceae bacterium]